MEEFYYTVTVVYKAHVFTQTTTDLDEAAITFNTMIENKYARYAYVTRKRKQTSVVSEIITEWSNN